MSMTNRAKMHNDQHDQHDDRGSTSAHDHVHNHKHSHGPFAFHSHRHDTTYLTSAKTSDAGVRITRIGLLSNLGMAMAKFIGGYLFHSQSMIADAWHSLTDLASDVLTLATVSWSSRPPTATYPLGFGKVESLGALGVSSMLLGGGLFMCLSSAETLYAHFALGSVATTADMIAHAHGHSHGVSGCAPSLHAAWLAAGTVLIKEWLYHATMRVARERKSSVLASNAIHHRIDSLTGIVTLAVVLSANLVQDAVWLDSVGGLLIALLVIKAGAENSLSALAELVDRRIDPGVRRAVREHTERVFLDIDGAAVADLHSVSGVKSGPNYLVDIELAVPDTLTVVEMRTIEDAVRARIAAKVRGVWRVRVRFVPRQAAASTHAFDEFISADASSQSSQEPEPELEDGSSLSESAPDSQHRKSE